MLEALKRFFAQHVAAREPEDATQALRLATAALLVEVARIDRDLDPEERALALRAVRGRFGLPPEEAEELLQLAEAEIGDAHDYYQFTSLINEHFSQTDNEAMIELMWRVAYADEQLSADELHLMRKMAGLLHVPDSAYIAAKMRAKDAAGSGA